MNFDTNILLALLFAVILLYIAGRILFVPIKLLGKLVVNAALGGAALWLVNTFGGVVGLHVGINIVTVLAAGLLGIPGLLMLIVLQYMK